MPPFAQSPPQTQILILEILTVFLCLKFPSSLTLNKIGYFSKLSNQRMMISQWGQAMVI